MPDEKEYICQICGQSKTTLGWLKYHMKWDHPGKDYSSPRALEVPELGGVCCYACKSHLDPPRGLMIICCRYCGAWCSAADGAKYDLPEFIPQKVGPAPQGNLRPAIQQILREMEGGNRLPPERKP